MRVFENEKNTLYDDDDLQMKYASGFKLMDVIDEFLNDCEL